MNGCDDETGRGLKCHSVQRHSSAKVKNLRRKNDAVKEIEKTRTHTHTERGVTMAKNRSQMEKTS